MGGGGSETIVQATGLRSESGSLHWKAARSLRTFPPHPQGMGRERSQGPGCFPRRRPGPGGPRTWYTVVAPPTTSSTNFGDFRPRGLRNRIHNRCGHCLAQDFVWSPWNGSKTNRGRGGCICGLAAPNKPALWDLWLAPGHEPQSVAKLRNITLGPERLFGATLWFHVHTSVGVAAAAAPSDPDATAAGEARAAAAIGEASVPDA